LWLGAAPVIDVLGRTQEATIINESGLGSLVLTSRNASERPGGDEKGVNTIDTLGGD
jgi:hypothetical protein